MKKFLFIVAVDTTSEVESRYPALGPAYLVSALRGYFGNDYFEFRIIERGSESEIFEQISEFNPQIIGISSVTQNFNLAKKYAAFAKSKNIPVMMGGVHVSMLPQSLSKDVDLACLGEGERTIVELMKLFKTKGGFPKINLKDQRGIAFWDEKNNLIITPSQPLIENLDEIKRPARDLLKIEKHSYIFSSRGCPYRCVFCASSRFWDKVRLFSARYVVDEIKELYEKYGVRMISFFDDLFIISIQRLEEIVSLLKKEGLLGKIKFTCSCRSNLVNERTAILLKEMGVVSVGLGLESGSERILKYLKGESISVEDNANAVRTFKKNGIAANASFVIGSPDETKKEMMQTYDFIKDNPLDLVDIYVLTPYPGTPIWDYAIRRGLVSGNMDWEELNINFERNKKAIILSEKLSREEIYSIYKKFRRLRLFKNLKNIWHHPFLIDLPRYVFRFIFEKANLLLKNRNV